MPRATMPKRHVPRRRRSALRVSQNRRRSARERGKVGSNAAWLVHAAEAEAHTELADDGVDVIDREAQFYRKHVYSRWD